MKRLLILALLSLVSLKGFAAGAGSHGGDAVVCYENNSEGLQIIKSIKKDYHEGRAPFEFEKFPTRLNKMVSIQTYDQWFADSLVMSSDRNAIVFDDSKNEFEWVDFILNKLSEKSTLGSELETSLDEIPLNSNWSLLNGVSEVDDTANADLLPRNCLLVQLAKQQGKIVTLDKNLYSLLSKKDKVSIILHEVIYYFEKNDRSLKSENSSKTRRLVGYLTTKDFLVDNPESTYKNILNIYGLRYFCKVNVGDLSSLAICDSIKRGEDNQIMSFKAGYELLLEYGELSKSSNVYYKELAFNENGEIKKALVASQCSSTSHYWAEFNQNKELLNYSLRSKSDLLNKIKLQNKEISQYFPGYDSYKYNCNNWGVEFYNDYVVKKINRLEIDGITVLLNMGSKEKVKFKQYTSIEFYENGNVKSGFIGESKIKIQGKKFKYGDYVEFHENGKLII